MDRVPGSLTTGDVTPRPRSESRSANTDVVSLADWRRRVTELYGSVRGAPEERVEDAWEQWRSQREALFREHPQSPIPAVERPGFRASHWPYDPALRFAVGVTPDRADDRAGGDSGGLALTLPVSDGAAMAFRRVGWLDIPFAQGIQRLALYWMAGYAGGLFLPFRDATNGSETYGAGRYLLDGAKGADLGADVEGCLILDFNFAFQPSCAFDPRWACPLAPPENRLDLAIRAGERIA